MLRFETVPSVSKLSCSTDSAMGNIKTSEKCQCYHENLWPNGHSNSELLLDSFWSSSHSRNHCSKKVVGKNFFEKKIKPPCWLNKCSHETSNPNLFYCVHNCWSKMRNCNRIRPKTGHEVKGSYSLSFWIHSNQWQKCNM